jgi:hypothetical protein
LKKILAYLLILNIFFTPVYLFFVIRDINRAVHIDDYKLINVKITNIIYDHDSKSGDYIYIKYQPYDNNNEIDDIRFSLKSKQYEHFKKMIKRGVSWEVFKAKTPPEVGDCIWVWHNNTAEDFYAFGKNDSFEKNRQLIIKTLIIFITLTSISIITISFGLSRKLLEKKEGSLEDLKTKFRKK